MSSDEASRIPSTANGFGHPFMKLAREIRDVILELATPDRVDVAKFELVPGTSPAFVPALAHKGPQQLQLECILATLQKAVLEVSTVADWHALRDWLASVDFTPLNEGLKDGFDAVSALGFSDFNSRGRHYHPIEKRAADGTMRKSPYSFPVPIVPSSWGHNSELTSMCKDLRTVEVEVALPRYFLERLSAGRSVAEAMQGEGRAISWTYQICRLPKLEGLKVLRLTFFTESWKSTLLNVEQERKIITWVREEFEKRGQSVDVVSEFGWWEES